MKSIIEVTNKNLDYKIPINIRGKLINQLNYNEIQISIDQINYTFPIQSFDGFHAISLNDKTNAVVSFFNANQLGKFQVNWENLNITPAINQSIHPEILFSIESIIFNFHLYKLKMRPKINVFYNSLFTSIEATYFEAIKFKISPNIIKNFEDYHQILNSPHIKKIRFDANQSLSTNQLKSFLKSVPQSILQKIDYIEEPTENLLEGYEILNELDIKTGIDESLMKYFNDFKLKDNCVFILKPGLLGFTPSLNLINDLVLTKKRIVISSAYEQFPDFICLLILSHHIDQVLNCNEFHGLDTFNIFSHYNDFINVKENVISLL